MGLEPVWSNFAGGGGDGQRASCLDPASVIGLTCIGAGQLLFSQRRSFVSYLKGAPSVTVACHHIVQSAFSLWNFDLKSGVAPVCDAGLVRRHKPVAKALF